MFRRLRLQFITIASLAILFILVFTVGIINTVRSFQTEQEISKVLNTLTENNGSFGKTKKIEINQGREIPSDSFRFFSATLSGDEVVSQDTSHTSLINDEEAATYARAASRMTSTLGTIREKNINLSYQVSKVSKNKEKAWEFIKYLVDNGAAEMYAVGNRIPAKISEQGIDKIKGDKFAEVFAEQINNGEPMPTVSEMGQLWEIHTNNIRSMWSGEQTPSQAANNIVKQLKEAIELMNSGK